MRSPWGADSSTRWTLCCNLMNMYGNFCLQHSYCESRYVERSSFRDKSTNSFLLCKSITRRCECSFIKGGCLEYNSWPIFWLQLVIVSLRRILLGRCLLHILIKVFSEEGLKVLFSFDVTNFVPILWIVI